MANFTSVAIFLPEIVSSQFAEILHEAICAIRGLPLPFSAAKIDHSSSIFIFLQHVEDYTFGLSSLLCICLDHKPSSLNFMTFSHICMDIFLDLPMVML